MPCCAKIESKGRPGVATVSGGRRSFWCDVEVQWGDPIATRQPEHDKVWRVLGFGQIRVALARVDGEIRASPVEAT